MMYTYTTYNVLYIDKLNNDPLIMEIKDIKIPGYTWKSHEYDNTIMVTVDDLDQQRHGIDYGDLHEALCRYLVDECGISSDTIKISDDSKNYPSHLVARVKFVGEGEIMAKIQGFLK